MEKDQQQFDLFDGKRLKKIGMATAETGKENVLSVARSIAVSIASKQPSIECTIDEVQRVLLEMGLDLGMAAGSVFKSDLWTFTGRHIRTHRKTSHARDIKVWRLNQ